MQKQFNDVESEKILLCQMLLDNKIIPEVNQTVNANSFYNPKYSKCFSEIVKMFVSGVKVDKPMFMTEFKDIDLTLKLEITDAIFSTANWRFYADKIRNCFIARQLRSLFLEKVDNITPENATEIAMESMTNTNEILSNVVQTEIFSYAEMIPEWMDSLEKRVQNRGTPCGTPTHLENLDDLLGGGLPDEYIFLGARPSIGKTALALQFANAMSEKKKVLFIELEMSRLGITERMVVNKSKIDIRNLRNGYLTQSHLMTLQNVCDKLYQNENIIFSFPKKRNINDIVATIRSQVALAGVNAVFIDHIGLIRAGGGYKANWEGVKDISNTLQMLQRELNIPFFTLIQLNREAERKESDLANISGSDVIVQDADIVMTLERKRQESADELFIPATLRILKNRNGACGDCHLLFMPKHVGFTVDTNPQEQGAMSA